jgi:hypothetical protein
MDLNEFEYPIVRNETGTDPLMIIEDPKGLTESTQVIYYYKAGKELKERIRLKQIIHLPTYSFINNLQ